MHGVSRFLKEAEGSVVCCSGVAKGEPQLEGPYYPAMSLNDGTEICVSPNHGTEDFPVVDVRVETPCAEGFKTLRVSCPYMEIIYNDGFSGEALANVMRAIGLNKVLLFDTSDRGWSNAEIV